MMQKILYILNTLIIWIIFIKTLKNTTKILIVFDMIADMHNTKILNKILTDLNHWFIISLVFIT